MPRPKRDETKIQEEALTVLDAWRDVDKLYSDEFDESTYLTDRRNDDELEIRQVPPGPVTVTRRCDKCSGTGSQQVCAFDRNVSTPFPCNKCKGTGELEETRPMTQAEKEAWLRAEEGG